MSEQWRIDNNGTGTTVSIYADDRLVADVYDDQDGLGIVADHGAARRPAVERQARDAEVDRLMHVTESMARWLDDEDLWCSASNPEGGGSKECDHCIITGMVKEADAAIAALARPDGSETDRVVNHSCGDPTCTDLSHLEIR